MPSRGSHNGPTEGVPSYWRTGERIKTMLHRNLGLAIAVAIVLGLTAQLHAGKPCCCPVTLCPPCEAAPAAPAAPPAAPAAEPADVSAPSDFDLASSLDAGSAPQAVAPNMIGDMFGPSGLLDPDDLRLFCARRSAWGRRPACEDCREQQPNAARSVSSTRITTFTTRFRAAPAMPRGTSTSTVSPSV